MSLRTMKNEVDSSMINSLTYVVDHDLLIAEFTNGDKYLYPGVTADLYDGIVNADSVGKEFNKVIKKCGFPYHKI